MPNVVCPTCGTTLAVTDAMLGGEVQCGHCKQVFRTTHAPPPPPKRATARREEDEDDDRRERPARRRDRRDEEEEDDEQPARRRSRSRRDDDEDRPTRRGRNDDSDEPEKRSRSTQIRTKYCHECGETIRKAAEICPECGVRQPRERRRDDEDYDYDYIPRRHGPEDPASKKVLAGIMGLLFGGLGIHKFVLGYGGAGAIMLLVTLFSLPFGIIFGTFTCGIGCIVSYIGGFVMGLIGFIEGIMYLATDDREFRRKHRRQDHPWF